jgi:exopolysaccharide biosynthesis polyprenyl glycosylphosphotransferase
MWRGVAAEEERPSRLSSIVRREALYRRTLAASDAIVFLLALWVGTVASGAGLTWVAALTVPGFVLLCKLLGLYDRDDCRLHKETLGEAPLLLGLSTFAALLTYLAQGGFVSGELDQAGVAVMWLALSVGVFSGRVASRLALNQLAEPERCLIVGDQLAARMLSRKLGILGLNARVVAVLRDKQFEEDHATRTERLTKMLGGMIEDCNIDRVIITSDRWRPDDIVHTIGDLKASGVKVSVLPPISRLANLSFEIDQLPGIALLGMRGFGISRSSRFLKRAFDATCSTLALIVLCPMMIAIAIAIRLDSPGPVLFRQRRIGCNGEPFEVLKFRSMVDGADQRKGELADLNEAEGLFKISQDPRITRVGHYLRLWNLDELPQLFNVLRGDMSLVGPRPLIPEEDEMILGAYRRRLDIPPGMTGHWQILGSWRIPLDEMMTLDYLYVANWSLWRDIKLLGQTIPYVLRRTGT